MRNVAITLALLAFPAIAQALDAELPDGWTEATRNNELIVFFKENEEAQARDIMAFTEFDGSPEAAFKVVTDFESYPKFMPFMKEVKVFKKTTPLDFVTYQVMAPPMIPQRDYFLHVKLTKGTKANGGVFKSEWNSAPETEPEKEGIVRMRINEGSWTFEPLDGGKRTRATYTQLTNPGGGLPKPAVDQSSIATIPNIFKSVRERVKEQAKVVSASH